MNDWQEELKKKRYFEIVSCTEQNPLHYKTNDKKKYLPYFSIDNARVIYKKGLNS